MAGRLDIAKFFPSIDHEILLGIVLRHTPEEMRWLAQTIVRHGGPCEPVTWHFAGDDLFTPTMRSRGLPIGNLTSQVWANAVLTPVDHMIASELGIGTFVRYSDEILIYGHSREQARRGLETHRASDGCAEGLRHPLEHPKAERLHAQRGHGGRRRSSPRGLPGNHFVAIALRAWGRLL